MNIDDLKNQWNVIDKKLEQSIRLNSELLRQSFLNKANTSLRKLSLAIVIELVLNFVVVILLGSFIGDHIYELKFLIPAIVLDLFSISLVAFSIHQLIALNSLDYSAPIITIQKKLGKLKLLRIRETKWVVLLSPLLWTPLLIVMLKGLLGLNAYIIFDHSWLLVNLLFGLAFIPLMVWLSKRYADKLQNSTLIQHLMNDIAGHNLNAATEFLNKLSSFEQDEKA
jgi:hypothetical protein